MWQRLLQERSLSSELPLSGLVLPLSLGFKIHARLGPFRSFLEDTYCALLRHLLDAGGRGRGPVLFVDKGVKGTAGCGREVPGSTTYRKSPRATKLSSQQRPAVRPA